MDIFYISKNLFLILIYQFNNYVIYFFGHFSFSDEDSKFFNDCPGSKECSRDGLKQIMKPKEKYCVHNPCDSPKDCAPSEICRDGHCVTPRCYKDNPGEYEEIKFYISVSFFFLMLNWRTENKLKYEISTSQNVHFLRNVLEVIVGIRNVTQNLVISYHEIHVGNLHSVQES